MSLSLFIPRNLALPTEDIDEFLEASRRDPGRSLIFFDEHVVGYVIQKDSASVSSVYLNVSIVPGPQEGGEDASSILSTPLGSDDIVLQGKGTIDEKHYLVWRFELPIVYPRKKYASPNIEFSCSSMAPPAPANGHLVVPPLPDLVATEKPNLLSELNHLATKSAHYYLLNTFVDEESDPEEVLPVPEAALLSSVVLPIAVCLVIRLKSTKPAGRNNILLATLNIEVSEELLAHVNSPHEYMFQIDEISMDFKYGSIVLVLGPIEYPLQYRLQDSLNLTYKLVNNEFLDHELKHDGQTNISKPVGIRLKLLVKLGADNVSNTITTVWQPTLDFGIIAPPINNSLKSLTNYSQLQISSHKPKLPKNLPSSSLPLLFSVPSQPVMTKRVKSFNSASSVTVNLTTNNSSLLGLRLTFKGKLNISLGEVTTWRLQAINNSHTRLNLSLIVTHPHPSSPNNHSSSNLDGEGKGLVYTKAQLHHTYTQLRHSHHGIIILDNDIRIGPVDANLVFETDIKLIGMTKGIFNLDGIKIFDVNLGDGIDFGKLVEVFVI